MSTIVGCSTNGGELLIHCKVGFLDSLMTNLGGISMILSLTSILWFVPGFIIAIISFIKDYDEMKVNNLTFKSLFKKFLFILFLFILLVYFYFYCCQLYLYLVYFLFIKILIDFYFLMVYFFVLRMRRIFNFLVINQRYIN